MNRSESSNSTVAIPSAIIFAAAFVFWFPFFNLDVVDKVGLTSLPLLSATKVARIFWFFGCSAITVAFLWRAWALGVFSKALRRVSTALLLWTVFAIWISLVDAKPLTLLGVYRALEYSSVVFGLVMVFELAKTDGNYPATDLMFDVLFGVGVFILLILLITLFIAPERAITELQVGRHRLGGHLWSEAFLMSQCLSLQIAVVYRYFNRRKNIGLLASISFLATTVCLLTDSRLGVFLVFYTTVTLIIFCLIRCNFYAASVIFLSVSLALVLAPEVRVHFPVLLEKTETTETTETTEKIVGEIRKSNENIELRSLNGRLPLFAIAAKGAKKHWINGVGYVEGVRHYIKSVHKDQWWLPSSTHNSYLELVLSIGILGALPTFVLIILALIVLARRVIFRDNSEETWCIAILFTSILLYGLLHTPFGNVYNSTTASFLFSAMILINKGRVFR